MRRITSLLAMLMIGLLALFASGCTAPEPKAADEVQEQIEGGTDEAQTSVDASLTAVRQKVTEFIEAGDGLETRVDGFQIKSDLREIERKLTSALEQSGDAKVATVEEISDGFENLIVRVETAAGKAPAGGELQAELTDLAARMRQAQTELGEAVAGYESAP